MDSSFDGLIPLSYDLIMVDPPWAYITRTKNGERKSAQAKYRCMNLEDIKALRVGQLARGDALLWLWATHPMIPQALEVLSCWGFRYVTSGVWVKTTVNDKLAFGTGYTLRSASEPFLIGKIGRPETSNDVRTVIIAQKRAHSRKPDEAYTAAEQLACGALKKADIFSRETRDGWDAWGDEAGMFDMTND